MNVAVASGKGGTGKTTVTASLASVWDGPLTAVDLDVEEPNLHLFLHPEIKGRETVGLTVPVVDEDRCTLCGACSELCQFKAISVMGDLVMTFPEMCHGCGGCLAVCPEKALSPGNRDLGEISWGRAGSVNFVMGQLRIGEAMSPPLMREVKAKLPGLFPDAAGDVIIDAPPGTSCPAINAVMDSDIIVLVTEPTPFGFHDFKLAVEAFTPLGKPMGVVINRAGLGDNAIYEYCKARNFPIWAEIPFDRRLAEAYSNGRIVAEACEDTRRIFTGLAERLRIVSGQKAAGREVSHA